MIETLAYAALVLFALRAIVTGDKTVVYVAAFCLPLTVSMPEPLGTISSPVNVIMLAIGLLALFHPKVRRPATDRLPLKIPVVLMILALLVGLAIHGSRELGGETFTLPFWEVCRFTWHWTMPLFLYAWLFRASGPGFVFSRLVNACRLSVMMECAVAVLERAMGANRSSAHLGDDNQAGAYFASASAFFLAQFLMERGARRWIQFGAWIVGMAGLFATLSRGGMAAAALSSTVIALLFLVLEGRRMGTKLIFIVLMVVAAMNFAVLVPSDVKDRVMETFGAASPESATEDDLDISTRQRLEYWQLAGELIHENMLGWGSQSFSDMLLARHGARKTTHNIYLLIAVEQGIQGFLAFLVLIGAVAWSLYHGFRRGPDDYYRMMSLGLLGWWISHLVAHFFLNSFFNPMVIGQFWMLLAGLFAIRADAKRVAEPAPSAQRAPGPIVAAGARRSRA